MALSAIHQAIIIRLKPFQKASQNVITFINEVGVSIYLYFDLLQTDYIESQNIDTRGLKDDMAWAMSMLLVLVIGINIVYSFSGVISKSFTLLKNHCFSIPEKDRVISIKPTKNQQFQEFERINERSITTVQITSNDGSRDEVEFIYKPNRFEWKLEQRNEIAY